MDAATLSEAMGGSLSKARYQALAPAFDAAMAQAECTTIRRAAQWCAQLGHESGGLKWMQELASGDAYEGRRDLGNTVKGDGRRFKGHGPIQITGRANHAAVSKWAHAKGYVPTPTYFVDHPDELAGDRYGFLGPVWYWTVARPTINAKADAGDTVAVTKLINGGTHGLADRQARYARCLKLGDRLLPSPVAAQEDDLPSVPEVTQGVWSAPIDDVYTTRPDDRMPAFATLAWACAHAAYARQSAERCERKLDQVLAALSKS